MYFRSVLDFINKEIVVVADKQFMSLNYAKNNCSVLWCYVKHKKSTI